jgi:hypothetical protein
LVKFDFNIQRSRRILKMKIAEPNIKRKEHFYEFYLY